VVAGLLSRRSHTRGLVLLMLLGVVASVAVLTRPTAAAGGQSLADRSGIEASRKAVGRIVPTVTARPIPARADFVADGSPSFITRTGISIGLISISRCRSCASRTGGCGYTGWLTGKSP
jgi:hypothetical protein